MMAALMRLYQREDLSYIAEAYGIFKNKMKAIKFVQIDLMMILKHHLLICTLKLIVVLQLNRYLKIRRRSEEAEILSEKNSDDSEDDEDEDINVFSSQKSIHSVSTNLLIRKLGLQVL